MSIKCSRLWKHVRVLKLSQNMRAANQEEFSKWLLDIGNGLSNERSLVEIPQQYIANKDIANEIYEDLINSLNSANLTNKTILSYRRHLQINLKLITFFAPRSTNKSTR
ncbi:putative DNA helicase PIF1, ATP-dependent, Helitron protein [Trachipleistophora hominis]|uniref:ATP-dependent DNA helicase n=1 Tax=Trachipleistophora hominis TaxID=72359 RepID=L7K0K5_TRAHO|nr:putative DNA helicase PIF1, ATP-dependent, Helitron protein [Trachipleistophora hominis]